MAMVEAEAEALAQQEVMATLPQGELVALELHHLFQVPQ